MLQKFTYLIPYLFFTFAVTALAQEKTLTILQEADELVEKGEFVKATEKYHEALSILREQQDRKAVADASNKLSVALRGLGKYDDALAVSNEALKIHEEIGDKVAVALDMTEIANVNVRMGKYDEALALAEKALAIHQNAQNKIGIVWTYVAIAMSYWNKGEYEKGTDYATRCLTLATEIGDKDGMTQGLNILGLINWEQGNYDRALGFYEKALLIARELLNQSRVSVILGNIGLVYWNKGDLDKALEYFNQSLEIARKLGNIHGAATTLYNIASVEGERGNSDRRHALLLEALNLAKQSNDKDLISVCLHSLGSYNLNVGNYDSAQEYYTKALQLAEEVGAKRTVSYTFSSMGELQLRKGDYASYLKYNEKALKIFEEIGEKRGMCAALNSIGHAHLKLGHQGQSLDFFRKALSIAQSLESKYEQADSYLGIGTAHYAKGEMKEADDALTRSVEFSQEIQSESFLWQALHKRGLVSRDTGKDMEALQFLRQAVDQIEKVRSEVGLAEHKAGYFVQKLDVYDDLVRLLIANKNNGEAYDYVQRAKARSFLDMLAEARIDPVGQIDPGLQQAKKKNLAELMNTEEKIRNEYENDKVDQQKIKILTTKRNELDMAYTELLFKVRKQNPRFSNVQYPSLLRLHEAQQIIDEQSVFLEYFLGKEESSVFVITPKSVRVFRLPGEQKLTEKVLGIRKVLEKPGPKWEVSEKSHSNYVKLASELYEELIAPVEKEITGKKRIIIAPDGVLNYLPFECLLSKRMKSGTIDFTRLSYLARDYEIQYIPSGSVFRALSAIAFQAKEKNQNELLAFADPIYSAASDFAALPNSRLEIERIALLYPKDKVTVFLGKDASEKNVKRIDLSGYKRVHFASHAAIDEERPEFSSLLLSTEEGSDEDGNLTMREVFDLNLKADLVVLSACKTGLGKRVRGEGVIGLSRAFLSAGTASVLVSLWDVSDRSTADLIADFYRNMTKGLSKAGALKEARLEMIQGGKYSHPYYWAPFALIGES